MYTCGRPSIMEEAYFAKVESQKRKKLAKMEEAVQEVAQIMNCPTCRGEMKSSMCHGVYVAKCQECNGMFIDEDRLGSLESKDTGFIDSIMGLFKS